MFENVSKFFKKEEPKLTYWQSIKNGYERGEASLGRVNIGMVAGAVGVGYYVIGGLVGGATGHYVVAKPKESLEQSLTVSLYFPNSFNS